jgi:uncharacterized protein YcfL
MKKTILIFLMSFVFIWCSNDNNDIKKNSIDNSEKILNINVENLDDNSKLDKSWNQWMSNKLDNTIFEDKKDKSF